MLGLPQSAIASPWHKLQLLVFLPFKDCVHGIVHVTFAGLTLSAMSVSPVPIAGPPPPGGQMAQPFMAQQGVRGASSRYVNTMSSSAGNRSGLLQAPL